MKQMNYVSEMKPFCPDDFAPFLILSAFLEFGTQFQPTIHQHDDSMKWIFQKMDTHKRQPNFSPLQLEILNEINGIMNVKSKKTNSYKTLIRRNQNDGNDEKQHLLCLQ